MATYAEIKAEHVAGRPPNTDPQRASETFAQYQARMKASGLPPDIDEGESDGDYETRLATYNPSPIVIKDAVLAANVVGTVATATLATTATLASTATLALTANTASYISSSATFDAGKTYNLSASYAP